MTEEKQELRKCSSCRCEILLETYFSKNRKGEYKRTCNPCLTKHKGDKCDYTTAKPFTLQRHQKQVHDKIKDYICDKCDYKFSTNGHLQRHIKMVHDKIKDHACDKCDYTCSTSSDLQAHIKMVHHKIKDYACDKCNFTCSSAGNLQAHIKTCTGNLDISSGELACRKALELLGIEYETEVSEIKNNEDNWLKWDFKITLDDKPAYIEYDGQAHYKPVCFGGMSKSQAKENLKKLQEHDQIKNEYCKKNNYPLLRIPYFRFEEVMELIREFVQSSSSSETS